MPAPQYALPITGSGSAFVSVSDHEQAVQVVADALYDEIGAVASSLSPAGAWSPASGSFPASAALGTFYFVSDAGALDGETFAAGDWLVPLVETPSTATYAGNWVRGDYSKVGVGPFASYADFAAWAGTYSAGVGQSAVADGVIYYYTGGAAVMGLPAGWRIAAGIRKASATVTVPTDYPTLQAAFDALEMVRPGNGYEIEIQIETGHTDATGLYLKGGDYSRFRITSVDATVPCDVQDNGGALMLSSDTGVSTGAHMVFRDCVGPKIDCVFDAQSSGGRYARGIIVYGPGASLDISGGGFINVGVPRLAGDPIETLADQAGVNILPWNGATVKAAGSNFSGAAARCAWVSRCATFNAPDVNLSGCRADGTVSAQDGACYVTRSSTANLNYGILTGSGHRGVSASRGCIVTVENADLTGTTDKALVVLRGGQIHAWGTRTPNATGADYPYTPSTQDIGGVAEFNFATGNGLILSDQHTDWPDRSFVTTDSIRWMVEKDADGTMTMFSRDLIELTYSTANTISKGVQLPATMWETDYFADVTVHGTTDGLEGLFHMEAYNRGVTSLTIAAKSNGAFSAGNTIDVMVKITGRWK